MGEPSVTAAHRYPTRRQRARMALAHAQPAAVVVTVATDAARPLSPAFAVDVAHTVAFLVTALAFAVDGPPHRHQCPLCAWSWSGRVYGSGDALTALRWLRCHHVATETWAYPVCVMAAALPYLALGTPRWASVVPVYVVWTIVAYASRRHRRLEPWCPVCHPWGWVSHAQPRPSPERTSA